MRPLQLLTMLAMLFVGLFANISANAQSSQNPGFGVGSGFDIHHGLVVGVTVAVVAVAAVEDHFPCPSQPRSCCGLYS